MKTIILLIFGTFTSLRVLSQHDSIVFKSISNTRLHQLASKMYLKENMSSEYYVETSNGLPYTGVAIAYFKNEPTDTMNLVNGVKHGFQKSYRFHEETSERRLWVIEYIDQINRIKLVIQNKYNGVRSGYIVHFDEESNNSFWFDYYPKKNKIVLKKSERVGAKRRKKKTREKFKSLDEFRNYMKAYPIVYDKCVEMKFFDEKW